MVHRIMVMKGGAGRRPAYLGESPGDGDTPEQVDGRRRDKPGGSTANRDDPRFGDDAARVVAPASIRVAHPPLLAYFLAAGASSRAMT